MKPLLCTTTPVSSRLAVSTSMHRALLPRIVLARSLPTALPPTRPAFRTLPSMLQQHTSPPIVKRSYSTAPNQHQVLQSFGTPFAHFIYTISRIARIITFTALGIGTIGIVSFEGAHQYVEHIAMPASSPSPSSADEYGWNHLALEESWSGSFSNPGTDPRLGVKGRHAVRSAWMCVNWGGGISPSVLFGGGAAGNSGLGRTAITSMSDAKSLQVEDGMILAMQYLNLAVEIAKQKGISLPDTGAIRAGLVPKEEAEQQLKRVDPLAVALEARLAAVKERQGSKGALESAIGSYEKLYDIETLTSGMQKEAERKVRLATKLADLHTALGRTEDAQAWLNRAVAIAANAGAVTRSPVDKEQKGWFSTPAVPEKIELREPSPALTRSLITALISKSAFHATSSLHQALQTQMSALQLTSAELSRSSTPTTSSSTHEELHNLWLDHHQSILNLHVAETVFAITKDTKLPGWFAGKKKGERRDRSLGWIEEALLRADRVVKELSEGGELREKWSKDKEVQLVATRLLRDANRVKEVAKRSRVTLQNQSS